MQCRADDITSERVVECGNGTEHRLSPDVPTVLVGHVTLQGAELAGLERTTLITSEPKFTVGQLAVSPIDYVALGHIHRAQDRNPSGHPPVVYSGSIERVTFKERDDEKGFYLVEVDPDREPRTHVTFVETPARAFVALHVDARDVEDPTERILDAIENAEIEGAVVRVRYRVEESQITLVDHDQLRSALADAETIAALERTVDPAERKRRTVVTRESSLEEAIRKYVGQNEDLQSIEDELVDAALDVAEELEDR